MTTQLATFLQDALGPDYRIEQELEGGGMSRVFLATDLRHDRRVVVKVLSPELASETSSARFKREIELTVRLQHPHILPILTSGARDDTLYYVSPFIPGESLRARIARDGKLPLADVVKFLRDVSGALAFAHQRGIVHRDVKPGNILLAEGHAILADFGIARAVATNATPLTQSGMVPGTPAYMAPELPTDEKADVYALGVVAYEMMCAALPKRGVTTKEIVAARGKVADDDAALVAAFAEIVADALSPALDSRIQSADEMRQRIEGLGRKSGPRPWLRVVAGVIALAIVALLAWSMAPRSPISDRYAVAHISGPDGPATVQALRQALSEWRGITISDAPTSSASMSPTDASREAKRNRASALVLLETSREADSLVVRATLRDASTDTLIRVRRTAFAASLPSASRTMLYRRLANALLRGGDDLPWRDASDSTTPSIVAWREYDRGRALATNWQLASAESAFTRALNVEPRLAPASLWLAQTIEWGNVRARLSDVKSSALRALEQRQLLRPIDSLQAVGLSLLAAGEYPRACDAFAGMIALDSTSVAGWIGAGDCRVMDRVVVPNRASRSGHVFRSSYEAAARAYLRASDFAPPGPSGEFHGSILGRLSAVLASAPNILRFGVRAGDSVSFAAFALLDHDTIAFEPGPTSELTHPAIPTNFALVQRAVSRNRTLMRRAAEDWVRRAPESAAAYDSLATWVEVSGGRTSIGDHDQTTLDVVRRALTLSRDTAQRIHLGVSEVRLLLKDGDFATARQHADSMLRAGVGRYRRYVHGVDGLAVLLGRWRDASMIAEHDSGNAHVVGGASGLLALPAQFASLRARLDVMSALAVPGDSIPSLARQVGELSRAYFPNAADAEAVRFGVLYPALTVAFPVGRDDLARLPAPQPPQFLVVHAAARRDSTLLRSLIQRATATAGANSVGSAMDLNLRRALADLAAADTAAALSELDPPLHALPALAPTLLREDSQIGALVRTMALRAEIAAARKDVTTQRRWASAVALLWKDADPELQPLVARMQALAR